MTDSPAGAQAAKRAAAASGTGRTGGVPSERDADRPFQVVGATASEGGLELLATELRGEALHDRVPPPLLVERHGEPGLLVERE